MKKVFLLVAAILGAQDLPEGALAVEGTRWSYVASESLLQVRLGEVQLRSPTSLRLRTVHGEYFLKDAIGRVGRNGFDLDSGQVFLVLKENVLVPLEATGLHPSNPLTKYHLPFKNLFSGTGGLLKLDLNLE